jgi:malate/lactate dehydrogenase
MKVKDVAAFVEKTGGPANSADIPVDEGGSITFPGLMMRDWFAGQALTVIAADGAFIRKARGEQAAAAIASAVYAIADAMLKERAK